MKALIKAIRNLPNHMFLFQELVKRDFEHKYKRTALGMLWSVLSPLLTLLVMKLVFTEFFGRNTPHYTTYLFAGNIVMGYYKEATRQGMNSLLDNAKILTKINIPKYLFLFSKIVSSLVNFSLTLLVFFLFCIIDHIQFGFHFISLLFPIVCLTLMNVGVGMILSVMFVFFRDTKYLYDVFLTLLTYLSAIFYTVDRFSASVQRVFLANPVYVYIKYFRTVVIDGHLPSLPYHGLCMFYALIFLIIGFVMYRKYNHQFVYYL